MTENSKSPRAQREEKILSFWKENKIFDKTLEKESPKGEFVFYDGPPFATGLPHYGSLLSSIVKDVVPRYKTMRGYHVRRRWGWDCHGLPIENMVEKELGLKSKKEIEEMGIAEFNAACRSSVLRFAEEWKRFVDRVGRFVDYDNSYKTMDNTYIESVWWALKEVHEKGLLYEGRKVLLYCPHCETPLAKAEIAMDQSYKDVTEESVYIKFKIRDEDKYILAWTTTPWTLPGNVALAVGEDIDYVEVRIKNQESSETLILAKERLSILDGDYTIINEMKGSELVGLEYESLFAIPAVGESGKKAWYVTGAEFVTTSDGTGVVHTAVIYGEEDYELGLKLDLPMVPLLDQAGHFNEKSPDLIKGQYFKKAEKVIKEDLEKRNLLFKREHYTHSYPHCHRCGTALLYNAISSWFINIQKIKPRLIDLNEKINWIPEHLKHGRFLNIVEDAPDWTISRNRYWASPLPIWKDDDGKIVMIGSVEELKKRTKMNGNEFYVMRHGIADNNVQKIVSCLEDNDHHLTEEGKEQVRDAARDLREKGIDLIISSPFIRTRETAHVVASVIDLDATNIVYDPRLGEYQTGVYEGQPESELRKYFDSRADFFNDRPEGGENFIEAKKRLGEFLYETNSQYQGKNILIITHKICGWLLAAVAEGLDPNESDKLMVYMLNADVRKLPFIPLPHNANFELDLHRPYIDEVELVSEDGSSLRRIPEVIDGWVESGSMPFAEYHYPFENVEDFEKRFPGDFISEYIAQTRTWFYNMHAIATILFDNISFKNVVTTGTLLAGDGSKMSKSKGNYTDPMLNIDKYGADSLRYYLMSSVVMQAEDVRFVDDEVKQVHNQVINILWNTFNFFEMYAQGTYDKDPHKSPHILDKWIIVRLNQLVEEVTESMDVYDLVRATRPIRDFISDFSTWYVRRSRDRFKGADESDKAFAISTTRYVLLQLSKVIAPVAPFIAEDIYGKIRGEDDPISVHLDAWPEAGSVDEEIIKNMAHTREIVTLALEARSKANIKVRQPLAKLEIRSAKLEAEYLELIKEEVNVKEVVKNESLTEEVVLDTTITPELEEEGRVRDIIRTIQDLRKERGLKPGEAMEYAVPDEDKEIFEKHKDKIRQATSVL